MSFDKDRIVGAVLARGGSRGIPRKNLLDLAGRPLIVRAVERLRAVPEISRLVVSTDDPEIARVAEDAGAEILSLRPAALARDDTPSLAVLDHLARELAAAGENAGVILSHQATSPLCTARDLSGAIAAFRGSSASHLKSVTRVTEHPHWMGRVEGGRYRPLVRSEERATRRQDLPELYRLNGAISVHRTARLLDGRGEEDDPLAFIMPADRSLDLDDPADWREAERRLESQTIPGIEGTPRVV